MNKLAANLIVKSIAPEVSVSYEADSETCFDHDMCAVIIGNDFQEDDCGFMRHLRYNHDFAQAYDYSLALWSLLHELGHYFTGNDGYIEDEDMAKYALCYMTPRDMAQDNPYIQNLYFNITNEWNATEWAIDWVVSHPRLSRLFNTLLK